MDRKRWEAEKKKGGGGDLKAAREGRERNTAEKQWKGGKRAKERATGIV